MYYLHFKDDKTDSEVWVEKRFALCEMVPSNLPHEGSPDEKPATLDPLLPGLSATGSVQQLSKPNNPEEFVKSLQGFMASIGQTVNVHPVICERRVNVMQLFVAVVRHGGSARVTRLNHWPYVAQQFGFHSQVPIAAQELRVYWVTNLAPYETMWQIKRQSKIQGQGQGQGLPLINNTRDIDDTERRTSGFDASHLPNQPRVADTISQVEPPSSKNLVSATLWEDEGTLCFHVESRGVCVARREGELQTLAFFPRIADSISQITT